MIWIMKWHKKGLLIAFSDNIVFITRYVKYRKLS